MTILSVYNIEVPKRPHETTRKFSTNSEKQMTTAFDRFGFFAHKNSKDCTIALKDTSKYNPVIIAVHKLTEKSRLQSESLP